MDIYIYTYERCSKPITELARVVLISCGFENVAFALREKEVSSPTSGSKSNAFYVKEKIRSNTYYFETQGRDVGAKNHEF